MATPLRQSTQRVVRIGPAVAVGDGFTPVTTLDLTTADEAEALREGTATLDISGATFAAVTGADGWYDLTLSTTATDTVGELVIVINDDSLILPLYVRFTVVEEAIYDALYAASASAWSGAAGSSIGVANVTQIGGDAQSATDLKDFADAGYDPSTNKVQGVVLVDTTTAVTNNVNAALINGAHGGAAATITFERIIGLATTTNANCVSLTGDGTGSGLRVISPAGTAMHVQSTNSKGMFVLGGAGSLAVQIGDDNDSGGMLIQSSTGGGDALGIDAQGDGMDGIAISANGAGGRGILCTSADSEAIHLAGGGTATGLGIVGGLTGGHGVSITGSGDDIFLANSDAPTLRAAILTAGAINATVAPNLDAAVSTRATPAQVATELGTYDAPTKAEMDSAVALLATNAQLVKVLAAVYDTATIAGDVITLSNAATQTITAGGRTTA